MDLRWVRMSARPSDTIKDTIAFWSTHYRFSPPRTSYIEHLNRSDMIYRKIKVNKTITPAFVRQLVRSYGDNLYINEPGDMDSKSALSEIVHSDRPFETFGGEGLYRGVRYNRYNGFFTRTGSSPERRYDIIYAKKKPEKFILKPFVEHIVKPYGLALNKTWDWP